MPHRKKKCINCKSFKPIDTGILCNQGFLCSNECRIEYGTRNTQKVIDKVRQDNKKQIKKDLREYRGNTRSKRLKEAQRAFNAYIRQRDSGRPCISCERTEVEWTRGGQWDCGHYLSIGSHPELRFNEDNAHKQCKKCNGGAGKFARKNHTVSQEYRLKLIEKIGLKRVEKLEGPHEANNYTCADLKEIELHYKSKLKELLQAN